MLDGIKDWLRALMRTSLEGFDTMIDDAKNVLAGDAITNSWDSMLAISSNLNAFCYVIIGICLLIELAQVASKVDIIKWEHGLKIAVKMVLAKVCIDIAPKFLKACYVQSQEWVTDIGGASTTIGTKAMDAIDPLITGVSGIGNILGLFLSSFIVLMAIKICGLLVQVMAYGRMFELFVYLVVSPLPCAFMPLGNGDGGGVSRITSKFFKNFIAVCLQGVMMVVVMQVFGAVIGDTIIDTIEHVGTADANAAVVDLIFTMLLGAIALVMSITKCSSWAKSIIDAM